MIFYFSGTGNSYAAAKTLADGLGEALYDLAAARREQKWDYTLQKGERLGFVFPIYAWAPPKAVTDFVKRLKLTYTDTPYTFAVCTCGSSAGNGMELFEIALEEIGLTPDSGFSVIMPDNYVVLFDTEAEDAVQQKLDDAEKTLHHILRAIRLQKRDFFRIHRGKFAELTTGVVNPIFRKAALRTKPFFATQSCIGCGLCASICTDGCIQMAGSRPVWMENQCNMCLACLHRCPTAAIQYGKTTANRGRYVHPIYRIEKGGDPKE